MPLLGPAKYIHGSKPVADISMHLNLLNWICLRNLIKDTTTSSILLQYNKKFTMIPAKHNNITAS
jgi:hypothetical protein